MVFVRSFFRMREGAVPPVPPEPFPATLLIGSLVAAAAVAGLGLLVYLKKRKR